MIKLNEIRKKADTAELIGVVDGQVVAQYFRELCDEIERLEIICKKQKEVMNQVDRTVFACFSIPTKVREEIQYIISPYVRKGESE